MPIKRNDNGANPLQTLSNKLGITDAVELARVEEKLSKARTHAIYQLIKQAVEAKFSAFLAEFGQP